MLHMLVKCQMDNNMDMEKNFGQTILNLVEVLKMG